MRNKLFSEHLPSLDLSGSEVQIFLEFKSLALKNTELMKKNKPSIGHAYLFDITKYAL
jgi:hypothetical protein